MTISTLVMVSRVLAESRGSVLVGCALGRFTDTVKSWVLRATMQVPLFDAFGWVIAPDKNVVGHHVSEIAHL